MAKRVRKEVKPKFDWSGFKLLGGVGVVMTAMGAFIFWAAYTIPEGAKATDSPNLRATQRIVRLIPDDVQSKIAMGIAVLFFLFGTFLLLSAIYRSIKFIITRRN
jgi:hypothetical protein